MKFFTVASFIISATIAAASPLEKRRGDVEGPFAIGLIAHAEVRGKYVNVDNNGVATVSTTPQKVFSINQKTHRLYHNPTNMVLDVAFNLDRPMIYHLAKLNESEYGYPLVAPISFKKESETYSVNTYFMAVGDLNLEILKGEYRNRWYYCKNGDVEQVRFDKVGGLLGQKEKGCIGPIKLEPVFD